MDINVGYDGLQNAATQLKSGKEEVTQKLQQLKSLIDQLTNSEFKTQMASGRFNESYQQWNSGATNVIEGLEGMSSYLNDVIREHQDLDSRLASGAS
jgi:WXG100 family type VII secretion target